MLYPQAPGGCPRCWRADHAWGAGCTGVHSQGGGVGRGLGTGWSFLVAQRQSFQCPQTSTDSDVSGPEKPSVGSEGETQKEASEGVQLGEGDPQTRNVMRSCAPRRALTGGTGSGSLLYCDKMNSPQVAHPAANFSSYLLCE